MYKYRKWMLLLLISMPFSYLSAQQIVGTTGALNAPTARMQKDKTITIGGGFLNEKITPPSFSYNSYNYYLNATFLPFVELSYSCTMIMATDRFVPEKKGRFVNQDRSMSARIRVLRERTYWPSIVVGGNDILSSVSNGDVDILQNSNQFYSTFYLAASKYFHLGKESLDLSLSYIYYRQKIGRGDCFSAAIAYKPSFAKDLNVIAEYDSRFFNIGANYTLFNHLFLQVLLQDGSYLSGGLAFKICLK